MKRHKTKGKILNLCPCLFQSRTGVKQQLREWNKNRCSLHVSWKIAAGILSPSGR